MWINICKQATQEDIIYHFLFAWGHAQESIPCHLPRHSPHWACRPSHQWWDWEITHQQVRWRRLIKIWLVRWFELSLRSAIREKCGKFEQEMDCWHSDLKFVKKFTRTNFWAKAFYTLKTRKSRLFSPAINSENASLSVIWASFG